MWLYKYINTTFSIISYNQLYVSVIFQSRLPFDKSFKKFKLNMLDLTKFGKVAMNLLEKVACY